MYVGYERVIALLGRWLRKKVAVARASAQNDAGM
jgi:hypothetical protein